VPERTLVEQAKTRLRRIEGQVRGIQGMLDCFDDDCDDPPLDQRVRELLDAGQAQAAVARSLAISRRRVSEIARGGPVATGEPCDGLLTQLLAVRAALEQVGGIIMELHLQRCLLEGLPADDSRVRELREALTLWSRLTSKALPAAARARPPRRG